MKTSVYIGTSLDGFIARSDGNIDWLIPYGNDDLNQAYIEFAKGIDAIVMGSGTYEKVLSFPEWPYDKPVFVLSSRLETPPEGRDVTFLSMKPRQVLDHLSSRGYSSLYIDGGKVIQAFLAEDLIDRLIIGWVPVLIGRGIPLFGALRSDLRFNHVRAEVFSNGIVQCYYERGR